MSSLVSRPEIFCWVLAGRRSRSLRLLVGQIRVSVQKARTSLSWSRQNSSRVRPVPLGGGAARAGDRPDFGEADPDGVAELADQRVSDGVGAE
jgi:hypothetical protein